MVTFVVPGNLDTPTGGYIYDRRIIDGLRAHGAQVDVRQLSSLFPFPDAAALRHAAEELAAIPDNAVTIVDGLAGGALPEQIERESSRLRIVALVHHPLAKETGLSGSAAAELTATERRSLQSVRHVIVTSSATAAVLSRDYAVEPRSEERRVGKECRL